MWEVLGIEPTTDVAQIRRAYAARLRAIGSDCDPALFMRLRQAYEAALESRGSASRLFIVGPATNDQEDASDTIAAETTIDRPADDGIADFALQPDAPLPSSSITTQDGEPSLADFDRAIAGKSTLEAWRCLDQLMARGVIAIGEEQAPTLRLGEFAVQDLDLSAETFAELVDHLGLGGETLHDDESSRLRRMIRERLAAERWLTTLQKTAGKRAWGKAEQIRIARAFVGTRRTRRLPGIKSGLLEKTIAEFHQHRSWIGHRMNLDRFASLEARFQRTMRWRCRRQKILGAFIWVYIAFMVLDLIFVLVTGGVKQQ